MAGEGRISFLWREKLMLGSVVQNMTNAYNPKHQASAGLEIQCVPKSDEDLVSLQSIVNTLLIK